MKNDFYKNKFTELISLCKKEIEAGGRIVVTGHDLPDNDSIISSVMLRYLLGKAGVESTIKFGTRPDNVTLRDATELDLLGGIFFDGFAGDDRLVLVDHHVCFYDNHVIACVDHHTTPPEANFDLNLVVKASSCGRVVYDMALSAGLDDDYLERLGITSVYLDTQSCKSPKFNQGDLPWLADGVERLMLDEKRLIKMGFCICDIADGAKVLSGYGLKRYPFGEKLGASTCVQIDIEKEDEWNTVIDEIVKILVGRMNDEGVFLWAFVVNKPEIARSDIYFIRPDGSVKIERLDRVASRSRDVIPYVRAEAEK